VIGLIRSLVVILQTDNIVFAEIITELHLNDRHRFLAAVSQTVISLRWNVDVLAAAKLQFLFAADDISDACDHNPVLAALRVPLQTQSRARFYFQHFYFKTRALFQNFVATPGSFIKFPHRLFLLY
jgi:hypothetical protein